MKGFTQASLSVTFALIVFFGAIGLAVWWLESRFGSVAAISTVGGVVGVIFYAAGSWQNQRNTKHAMHTMADVIDSVEQTRSSRANVEREYARMEREQLAAYAKMQVIDVQRVNQLATQQARLLMDTERRGWEFEQAQQQQACQPAAWAMDDDDDDAGVRYYE